MFLKRRRFLACILAAVLITLMLPFSAFALAEDEPEESNDAEIQASADFAISPRIISSLSFVNDDISFIVGDAYKADAERRRKVEVALNNSSGDDAVKWSLEGDDAGKYAFYSVDFDTVPEATASTTISTSGESTAYVWLGVRDGDTVSGDDEVIVVVGTAGSGFSETISKQVTITPLTLEITSEQPEYVVGDGSGQPAKQIRAGISPSEAYNTDINWSINNNKFEITADDSVVTGSAISLKIKSGQTIAAGESATITATSDADESVKDTVKIKVNPISIKINSEAPEFIVGDTSTASRKQITSEVTPSSAGNKDVIWSIEGKNAANYALYSSETAGTEITQGQATNLKNVYIGVKSKAVAETDSDIKVVVKSAADTTKSASISIVITSVSIDITSAAPEFSIGDTSADGRKQIQSAMTPSNLSNQNVLWSIEGSTASKYTLYTSQTGNTELSQNTATQAKTVFIGVKPGETAESDSSLKVVVKSDADNTKTAEISVKLNMAAKISGTAYSYISGGSKQTIANVDIQVYNSKNVYVGLVKTGPDGKYSLNIPADKRTDSYSINASSYFSFHTHSYYRKLLNEKEDNFQSGRRTVNKVNDVDFVFVEPLIIKGKFIDASNNSPIPNMNLYVSGYANADGNGEFEYPLDRQVLGNSSISMSINVNSSYAAYYNRDYVSTSRTVSVSPKIDDYIQGNPIIAGDIPVSRANRTGIFGNAAKNNLALVPSMATSNELSNATLKFYANGGSQINGAKITVTSSNGSRIQVPNINFISVKQANGTPVSITNLACNSSELTFNMDIKPYVDYVVLFGIYAPSDSTVQSYEVTASINANGVNHKIGEQTITINNITVNAPSEIGNGDRPTITGEVISSEGSEVELIIKQVLGGEEVYNKSTSVSKGAMYKFENINLKTLDYGAYSVTANAKINKSIVATETTYMYVVERPVSLSMISLYDRNSNRSEKVKPSNGDFVTFNAWVDTNLRVDDSRQLSAGVSVDNPGDVKSARFILNTNMGEYSYDALYNNSAYTAELKNFYGSGKATVTFEITKPDGSVVEFLMGRLIMLIDPSGYVYDTSTNQRISGATATLYYIDESEGVTDWTIWPAENYSQINPQITDTDGSYGWMVPEGMYRIDVTKDGYHSYSTLDDSKYRDITVLPERKDIFIGMTSKNLGNVNDDSTSSSDSDSTDSKTTELTLDEKVLNQLSKDKSPDVTLGSSQKSISLSGKTLLEVASENQAISINSGTASLILSTENIEGLSLKSSDKVSIVFEKVSLPITADNDSINSKLLANGYEVKVLVNNKEVSYYGKPISIVYDISSFKLSDAQKEKLTGISYNGKDGYSKLGGTLISKNKFEIMTSKLGTHGIIVTDSLVSIKMSIDNTEYNLNGERKTADVAPVIIDNRTMVPIRFIAEAMGAEVDWIAETKTCIIELEGKTLQLQVGQKNSDMDVPPEIVNDRVLVPLRYVSEQLDANVIWNEDDRSLRIFR